MNTADIIVIAVLAVLAAAAVVCSFTLTVVFKVNIYLTFTTPCGRILVFYAEIVFLKNHGCLP